MELNVIEMGPDQTARTEPLQVSVITTVLNEGTEVLEMLDSVLSGTVSPSEIVVVDGGSTDGSLELLEGYSRSHPSVRVLTVKGGNRSQGRNAAIAAATHDHIVCIDGGCLAQTTWLEEITKPLIAGAEWVAGFYRPRGKTSLATAVGLTMVFVEEEVIFPDFLPSARSMAFHRRIWSEVGGFPETAVVNEDTSFGEALTNSGRLPVFAPKAVVAWRPPGGFLSQARTSFAWGRGDGHFGLRSMHYRHLFPRFVGAAGLLPLGLLDPVLLLIAPIPLVPEVRRKSKEKYRHMSGRLKLIWIPLATMNTLGFTLAGYIVGYLERRSGRWTLSSVDARARS